jgi:hypothetical protein
VHQQFQSILFGKVPFEVRSLIFREVLGGWILLFGREEHGRTEPRLVGKVNMITSEQQGRNVVSYGRKDSAHGQNGLVSLVKTCRRMYACHLPSSITPPSPVSTCFVSVWPFFKPRDNGCWEVKEFSLTAAMRRQIF